MRMPAATFPREHTPLQPHELEALKRELGHLKGENGQDVHSLSALFGHMKASQWACWSLVYGFALLFVSVILTGCLG